MDFSTPNVADLVARALANEPHLSWAYLFGSAARGQPFRDVDVAVMPAPHTFESPVEIGALASRIHRSLGLGVPVDVVDLRDASLPFLASILREGRVVLDREPAGRRLWAARRMVEWLDFQPLWEMQARLRRQALHR